MAEREARATNSQGDIVTASELKALAVDIHANAVEHGWWEGERSDATVIALIHSEWSEALEEYRAGKPMRYHVVDMYDGQGRIYPAIRTDLMPEEFVKLKPEGIAVELIDGCIRILDYIAYLDRRNALDEVEDIITLYGNVKDTSLPDMVSFLHWTTAMSLDFDFDYEQLSRHVKEGYLVYALSLVLVYVKMQGLNPMDILREKHEYNKTRSYKHGDKIC